MEPWQKLMTTANDSTVDADTAEEVSDNDYQRKTLSLYTMTKSQSNKALSQWNDVQHKASKFNRDCNSNACNAYKAH